jgi:hypothetical protein
MADRRGIVFFVIVAGGLLGGGARGDDGEAERDRLIALIAKGSDVDGNTKKFAALLHERDKTIATSQAAKDAERAARQAESEARRAQADWRREYERSADYEIGWRCTLSVDPKNPVPSDEGRFRADWGRVVKKESVRLAPKNALDEGEPATLFEIAGQARHYFMRGEKHRLSSSAGDLDGDVGDWMVVCDGGNDAGSRRYRTGADDPAERAPEYWRGRLEPEVFAARITAPPKIAQKARWNPRHITSARYFWAIHDVKWKYPLDEFVLSNLTLTRQVGARWEIEVDNRLSFLVEVPPSLPRRDALRAGRNAWLILGQPRFDATLHKLVLVAADVEPSYVTEK